MTPSDLSLVRTAALMIVASAAALLFGAKLASEGFHFSLSVRLRAQFEALAWAGIVLVYSFQRASG